MKKALVVLLILAVAGGLFAQELTWGGAVKTGLKFSYADDGDSDTEAEDPVIAFYNDDAGKLFRIDLTGAYTNENYGVVLRLRAQANAFGAPTSVSQAISFHQAYGWATFLNDVLKISAGIIDDGTWKTGGVENWGVSGKGVRFELAPLAGLNLGVLLQVPGGNANGNIVDGFTAKDFFAETAIGASYASDLFSIGGAILLDGQGDNLQVIGNLGPFQGVGTGDASGDPGEYVIGLADVDADGKIKDTDKGLTFQAGVAVTPIAGLAITAEGRARNMGDFAKYGWFWLNEKVSYGALLDEKLTVAVKATQNIWGEDFGKAVSALPDGLKPHLQFTPSVGYAVLDNVDVGLEATIGLWPDVYATDFSIKPSVGYAIGAGASINAFYELGISKLDADGAKTQTGHTVQVDLIWTF
jgi:hypothetical protein